MTTTQPAGVVTNSSGGYVSTVLRPAVQLVSETKTRAGLYVSTMEQWIGHSFGRRTQWLAMAAVSGLAVTSAVAAKVGVLGPSYHEVTTFFHAEGFGPTGVLTGKIEASKERERLREEKAMTAQKDYDALLKQHESAMSATSLTNQEVKQLRLDHDRLATLHTTTVADYEEKIRSLVERNLVLEKQQTEAEDLISVSVTKITRLEEDLLTSIAVHQKEMKLAESERHVVLSLADTKTSQLDTSKEELSQAQSLVADLKNSLEDLEARLTARDGELKNLRDHRVEMDVTYNDSLGHLRQDIAQKEIRIEELLESRMTQETHLKAKAVELEDLNAVLRRVQLDLENSQRERDTLDTDMQNLKSEHREIMNTKEAETNDWIGKHKDVQDDLDTHVMKVLDLQRSISGHEKEVLQYRKVNDDLSSSIAQSRSEIVTITNEHNEHVNRHQAELSSLKLDSESQLRRKDEQVEELSAASAQRKTELETFRDEVQKRQAEVTDLRVQLDDQLQTHARTIADTKRSHAEAISGVESRVTEKEHLLNRLQEELQEIQRTMKEQAVKMEKGTASTNALEKSLHEASEHRRALEVQVSDLLSSRNTSAVEIQDLKTELDSLRSANVEASLQVADDHHRELETWQNSLARERTRADASQNELVTVRSALRSGHEEHLRDIKSMHESELLDINESHAAEVEYMRQAITKSQAALSQVNLDFESSSKALQGIQQENLALKQNHTAKLEALELQIREQGGMITLLQSQARSPVSEASSTNLQEHVESLGLKSPTNETQGVARSPSVRTTDPNASDVQHLIEVYNQNRPPSQRISISTSDHRHQYSAASDSTSGMKHATSVDSKSRSLAYTSSSSEGETHQSQALYKKENRVLGVAENNFSRPSTSGTQSVRRVPSLTLTPSKTSLPMQPDVLNYVATGTTTPSSNFGDDHGTPPSKKSKGLKGLIRRTSQKLSRSPSTKYAPSSPSIPTHYQDESTRNSFVASDARSSAIGRLSRQVSLTKK